jgi:L-amino acid N-acyltransferase YncA
MDFIIREARPDDAAGMIAILNAIIAAGTYTVMDTPFTVEEQREYILNFPPRGIFHVAERVDDHKLVGLQTTEPFATYTHAFDHVGVIGTHVDLNARRQGIATRLFAATYEVARRKGYEKFFTYVRADNQTALATYMSQCFRIVGTAQRQAKLNGKYVDEIIIEKFL